MDESCHACECVTSHICTTSVTHMSKATSKPERKERYKEREQKRKFARARAREWVYGVGDI